VPLIDFTYPAGALEPERRQDLVRTLGDLMLKWEGAPDTDFFQSVMWVNVHELPAADAYAAGVPVGDEPRFLVRITVPEGALSDRRKEGVVKEMTEAVREAAGLGEDAALRVWVLIGEVPDGNWGAAGNVVRFAELREIARQEREAAPAAAGD
jgi:phenylpyruvate tautomerase PptA (4-oxalocrotonate tautomerase family)